MTDYNYNFSRYYSILTQHKDYDGEVARLVELLGDSTSHTFDNLLSIGCGIGQHERLLSKYFRRVVGVDTSREMIEFGNQQSNPSNLILRHTDIFQLEQSGFSCAVSLFNVVNCVEQLDDLSAFFSAIAQRLVTDAPFLFEVWHAEETVKHPPTVVVRDYQMNGVSLERTASPKMHSGKHLELRYDVSGHDGDQHVVFDSIHHIFLHTIDQIEVSLRASGFVDYSWYSALSEGSRTMAKNDRMLLCRARKTSLDAKA
jgi:SAM-dependent methyltransferase